MKHLLMFVSMCLIACAQPPLEFSARVERATKPTRHRSAPSADEYGQGEGKILILVIGHVPRPGAYYLKGDALLIDALEAAGGINFPNHWTYNRITTKNQDGKSVSTQFREDKVEVCSMKLKEGDRIIISDADL